jgi:hypothetical protein
MADVEPRGLGCVVEGSIVDPNCLLNVDFLTIWPTRHFHGKLAERSSYADAQPPKHPHVIPKMNRKASEHKHQKYQCECATHSTHVVIIGSVSGSPFAWEECRYVCQKKQNEHWDTKPQRMKQPNRINTTVYDIVMEQFIGVAGQGSLSNVSKRRIPDHHTKISGLGI